MIKLLTVTMLFFSACANKDNKPSFGFEPCSSKWYAHINSLLEPQDFDGHGPDPASDEWKSVIAFRLGIRGNLDIPNKSTKQWCEFIDQKIY